MSEQDRCLWPLGECSKADALDAAKARIAELEAERNALREALYIYGDRTKMGSVLISTLQQYGAARSAALRDTEEGGG